MTNPPKTQGSDNPSEPSIVTAEQRLDRLRSALGQIPAWFVGLFAILYFSGYGIDVFYCSSFGIYNHNQDTIKLRYVYIGFDFFMLVVIFCASICFGGFAFKRTYRPFRTERSFFTNVCTSIFGFAWPMSVYSFIVFTPQEYFSSEYNRLRAVLAVIVIALPLVYMGSVWMFENSTLNEARIKSKLLLVKLGIIAARKAKLSGRAFFYSLLSLRNSLNIERFPPTKGLRSRTIGDRKFVAVTFPSICALMCVSDFYILFPVFSGSTVAVSSIAFALCCLLLSSFIAMYARLQIRLHKANVVLFDVVNHSLIFASSIVVSFFLLVVTYTYGVLVNIPSSKGGSDFTHAPIVKLFLKAEGQSTKNPDDLEKGEFVLLYDTSSTVFLAKIQKDNDPCNWKYGDSNGNAVKPSILQLNRTDIRLIENRGPVDPMKETNCCKKTSGSGDGRKLEGPQVCETTSH